MSDTLKWILMSIVLTAIIIGVLVYQIVRKDQILREEGVVTWAKVTGSHSVTRNKGGRRPSQTTTVYYLDISFHAGDKLYVNELTRPSELKNLNAGDSIKIIYANSDPEIIDFFKDENKKFSVKKVYRHRTRFYSAQ